MDKQIVILNMKSRFLLSVVFFGMIAGLSASPVYRMGSYNIRGENAADTGDKDWNVRKEYVVRNIVEHDFDVEGLRMFTVYCNFAFSESFGSINVL
jgi:hypothetical protein